VGDLSGTDVTEADVGLDGTPKATGDGALDNVSVIGTGGPDTATITGDAQDGVTVSGLHALVQIFGVEPSDALTVKALAGDDTIDATGLAEGTMGLTAIGGAGTDTMSGPPGAVLIQ